MRRMLPDFFVIGAQKAGSTYLLRCLGEHPQIFMPPAEVAFFENGLYSEERIGRFERHFDAARPGQVIGVKRPNVLGLPECPVRLRRHMPDLKLVAILRDPIERAVSGYFHYMRTGMVPIVPVEVGLNRLLDGQYRDLPRARDILEFGFYGKHLRAYEAVFSRDRFCVTLLDDVRRNARGELDRIFEFLGVRRDFEPSSLDRRPMAAPYSLTRLRLWDAVARYYREWTHDGKFLRRRRGIVASPLHAMNLALDHFVWSRLFRARRPRLSPALAARLADLYRDDIESLEAWLGHSLAGWKESAESRV